MTGKVVNLRRARKQRARAAEDAVAAANRTAFGLTRQARTTADAERGLADRRLSGHRLDPAPPSDDD